MIDVRRLRDEPDALADALARKGVAPDEVARAAAADAAWRGAQAETDALRQRRNEGSKVIGRAAPAERPALIAEMNAVKEKLAAAEERLAAAEVAARAALEALPNPPSPEAPAGGEDDHRVVKVVGAVGPLGEGHLDHAAAGERFGLWDTARGAKVSGSRFSYITGAGALLQQALVRLALDTVVAHGFVPVVTPVLVREHAMYGTGFFPAEKFEYYEVDGGDLYLVGTSEVPLAAYHGDEILADLPLRYAGLSSCFRREAGAYGKDTSGIFRVHQFFKVEMFSFVEPSASAAEHERILAVEEEIVQALGLPYRVVDVAAGDLGASATRKFDVEAWLPSEGRYREITSCSNCTDFQARRLGIRRRTEAGTEVVHTLNGTAVTDRWLVFVAEHCQQPDGTLAVPDALVPHMPGGLRVVAAAAPA